MVASGCRIGEVIANVAHVGSSEECVADGMYQHVGIAVAKESQRMFYLDAAHPEVAAFHQLVDIVSHSYAYIHS